MRLTSSRAYSRPPPLPKMPPGLVELMDGLARDVLMHNPTNVFDFCANHMEKLLEIRDGPSVKKSLTLEQKILKAQEKMKRKAQERRDRFDKETKLRSNDDTIGNDKKDNLVPEESVVPGPSHRAQIHHEVDLKDSSEVEISHIPQVDKAVLGELTDSLNIEESNLIKEDPRSVGADNIIEAEIKSSDNAQGVETKYDKKLDDEQIFGKLDVNIESLKESRREEIVEMVAIDSPLQTITEGAEEFFVNNNAVVLPKITIGDEHDDYDHDLHDNVVSSESGQEVKPDTVTELRNELVSEYTKEKPSDLQNKSVNSKSNDVTDGQNTENGSITAVSVHNSEKDTGDSTSANNDQQKDETITDTISEITQITNNSVVDDITEAKSHDSNVLLDVSSDGSNKISTNETHSNDSQVASVADVLDVKDSHDGDLLIETTEGKTVSIELLNITEAEADDVNLKENEASIKSETGGEHVTKTTENEPNLNAETDAHHENITTENEPYLKSETGLESETMVKDNGLNSKVGTDVEPVTLAIENEPHLKSEMHVKEANMSTENKDNVKEETYDEHIIPEIRNAESNIKIIDAGKVEPEMHKLKVDEENLDNNFEKYQDNTEISLQTDSTENTNEDSLSIVQSDLSKTDDDSTQINPNVDLETAAVTIQKVFRSFMFKSRNSTFEDTANDEHNSVDEDNDKKEEYYAAANLNKERRPLGITRMDTVLQTVNEEKSLSLSTDDSSTLSSAATTIQAHVRGFLARNRLNSSKTFSMNSLVNSHEVLEADPEQHKNKTILNIHIVPEEGNYLSRDESLLTSMDLSLDGSPPSSVNLHPLSCDISERRKMLKREDAVQSVTPPSNNSGKLSEDSVKEVLITENGVLEREPTDDKTIEIDDLSKEADNAASDVASSASTVTPTTVITISKSEDPIKSPRENTEADLRRNGRSLTKLSSDESDVITPYVPSPRSSEDSTHLLHSGEFHDVVLPTKVSRNDTSAVREFKNVLVYFLLWNNS